MGKNRLITEEKSIAKIFNDYFTSIIKHLHIERKEFDSNNVKFSNNAVLSAVNKSQNHTSILKIKSNRTYSGFSFRPVNYEEALTELKKSRYIKNKSTGRSSYKNCEGRLKYFCYIFS